MKSKVLGGYCCLKKSCESTQSCCKRFMCMISLQILGFILDGVLLGGSQYTFQAAYVWVD